MRSRKSAYLGAILLISLYILNNFELKKVYDLNYNSRYGLDSKEPFGLYVLNNLIKNKYGENSVKEYSKSKIKEINEPNLTDTSKSFKGYLIIQISNKIYYNHEDASVLENFLAKGGKILLSSPDIDVDGKVINIYSENSLSIPDSMSFKDIARDSTLSYLNYYKNSKDYMRSDKLSEHYFTPKDDCDTSLFTYFETPFVTHHYKDQVTLHGFPNLFTNLGAKQDYYIDHLNRIIDDPNIKNIIFIKGSGDSLDDQSLLNVVFKNRGLKFAYITLIIGGLLLLIFNTKRKQRILDILPEKPNQTLAYANTLARLYQASNKHHFLVKQMKDNFLNYVQDQYHLKPSDDNYQMNLAKKAKVDLNTIKNIFREFEDLSLNDKTNEYSLIKLHNIITSFKKISNGG